MYMGAVAPTPGAKSAPYVDLGGLGAQQRPGRRPSWRRREDIVDQDDATAREVGDAIGCDLEGALGVAARCGRDSPICCSVGRTRRSASVATSRRFGAQ